MSSLAARNIHQALGCVEQQLHKLREGSIEIKTLQLLTANRDRFLAIVEAAVKGSASVAAVLDLRNYELQTYNSTATHLDKLLEYCKQCLKTGG